MLSTIKFPVLNVKMIPIDKIESNEYNPNKVAPVELKLLKLSIEEDGYTQPIVVYYDLEKDKYIIVDGFHRYKVGKNEFNLTELPCTVIDKPIENRMASTIRHNRARGKHEIDSMTDIVQSLLLKGWDDVKIMKELGMDKDEVLRFKQNIGLPEVFKDEDYSKSWYPENVTNDL